MTDEQIIKALECCIGGKTCINCPLKTDDACFQTVRVEALGIINRQNLTIDELTKAYKSLKSEKNAELEQKTMDVERLNKEVDRLSQCVMYHDGHIADAIKEFAEKVNLIVEELVDIMFDGNESKCKISNCHKHSSIPCESPNCIKENKAYWKMRILNLAKEMVGDE